MLKSFYLMACILLLSLSSTAARGAQSEDRSYALFGEIVTVNVETATIKIKFLNDSEQDVLLAENTVLIRERKAAVLTEFKQGDYIFAFGTRNESGFVAHRIIGSELPERLAREEHGGLKDLLAHISSHLDLTSAQLEQIKMILQDKRPKVQQLLVQLIVAEAALRGSTQNGRFNLMSVTFIANQQGQTIAKLIVEKERLISEIYRVLTPEQQIRFNQFQGKFLDILAKSLTHLGQANAGSSGIRFW